MTCFRLAATVFLTLTLSGYAIPASHPLYSSKRCTISGARCAGEKNYPAVPWLGCCSMDDSCIPDETKGYGRFCMAKPKDYGKGKCYPSGSRCLGAVGMPYVPWHRCCNQNETCQVKASMGWGGFCLKYGSVYSRLKNAGETTIKPSYPNEGNSHVSSTEGLGLKCYKSWERCMGEYSYPFVPYNHCCSESESCVADSKMGWGGHCKKIEQGKYIEKFDLEDAEFEYNSDFAYKRSDYQMTSPESNLFSSYGSQDVFDKLAVNKAPATKVSNKYNYRYGKTSNTSSDYSPDVVQEVGDELEKKNSPKAKEVKLPATFGCSTQGGAMFDEKPSPGLFTFDVIVEIPPCENGAVLSEAEKNLLVDTICEPVQANSQAVCFFKSLPAGTQGFVIGVVVQSSLEDDPATLSPQDLVQLSAELKASNDEVLKLAFPKAIVQIVEQLVEPMYSPEGAD